MTDEPQDSGVGAGPRANVALWVMLVDTMGRTSLAILTSGPSASGTARR